MRSVAVFGSARVEPGDREYEDARRMGALAAEAGWVVMTGGYSGVMEAASRGAAEAGGHVIGVTVAAWAGRNAPNAWVAEEQIARDLFGRLERLVAADALVGVGGGIGTLAEVSLAWNLRQKSDGGHGPLILVGEAWSRVVGTLARELVIDDVDIALLRMAGDPEDAAAILRALGA